MLREANQYLWYSAKPGGRQEDGFFVERTGRILFWPDNGPMAYSLTPDVADRIRNIKARAETSDYVIIFFLLFAACFLKITFRSRMLQDRFLEFTHNTLSLGPACLAAVFIALFLMYLVRGAIKQSAIGKILKSCSFVEQRPHPEAQYLKLSSCMSVMGVKPRPPKKILLAFVGAVLIYGIYEELRGPYPGNALVVGALMAFLTAFSARLWRREQTGLRPDQIKVLNFSSPAGPIQGK